MRPPLIGGGIKRLLLSESVCLSRTSGPPNSKTERPRKTKIGTEVAHVTCDSDTTSGSKGQRSRSPGRFTHRGLNAWGRCSGDRENVLGVGNYCYVASARRRARRCGAHWGGEGRGISCHHAHSTSACVYCIDCVLIVVSLMFVLLLGVDHWCKSYPRALHVPSCERKGLTAHYVI